MPQDHRSHQPAVLIDEIDVELVSEVIHECFWKSDPSQNFSRFRDHLLDVLVEISASACSFAPPRSLDRIPWSTIDRMEVIRFGC
jgi:ATP-dependent Lon protease